MADDRAAGAWGYEVQEHVNMKIPAELVQAVGEFVADPDAFVAAIAASASGPRLVEVDNGVWVDPGRIVAMHEEPLDPSVALHLEGGHRLVVNGTVAEVTAKLVGPED